MDDLELKTAGNAIVGQTVEKARAIWPTLRNRPDPIIRWVDVARGTAGRGSGTFVEFNLYHARKHKEDYLARTVPHEVAHWAEVNVYGKGGHGATWKRVMHAIGQEPVRCHSYDLSEIRPHELVCSCCATTYQISKRKYNAVLRGQRYYCRPCGVKSTLAPKWSQEKVAADREILVKADKARW